jgi:hypothetical protein
VATDEVGNHGFRTVEGPTCVEVAHALAFLAGLAIELGGTLEPDPSAERAPPAVSVPPLPEAPPPSVEPTASAISPRPVARPPPSVHSALVALAELRYGLAGDPRPGVALAYDMEAVGLSLFAPSARLAVAGSASQLESSAGNADLWLLAARLEGCPARLGTTQVDLRLCVGGELGNVWARGSVVVNPRSVNVLWGAAEVTLRLRWTVRPGPEPAGSAFFVEAGGGAELTFGRERYFFEPSSVLYTVPPVTARAAIGPGFRF